MGLLVDGEWKDKWYDTDDGRFKRQDSVFRNWVTRDGTAGPSGKSGFKAEAGRYHLYVSLACPWAHRTLVMRKLKGLEDMVDVSVVGMKMLDHGWTFDAKDGSTGDPLYGADYLHEIYTRAKPDYSGRVTVPVLWDKKTETIVSNESAEIIRMMNSAFDDIGGAKADYYPAALQDDINDVNDRIYDTVNNGVYKAGFATTQDAYEEAVKPLFDTLDWTEARLADNRYLMGAAFTEADIRLFTTLVRFDPVYVGHFKCNIRRIADYPELSAYLREIYQMPGVAETVDMTHIKTHYYASHKTINPTGIVPEGPEQDLTAPHGRDWL
ncbi:glutathione S-transferase family protein [Kordiimonas sp.]|uniref:glutathione S-transferase family protein n=1 Tax=Kordiimonas sp. TaxID=1970157 RepID=UPI003A8E6EF4